MFATLFTADSFAEEKCRNPAFSDPFTRVYRGSMIIRHDFHGPSDYGDPCNIISNKHHVSALYTVN